MGSKQAGELPVRSFSDLTEREILALAISNQEEDGRIYADFAEGLQENYPDTARVFEDMAAQENEHRRVLIDKFVEKFDNHIPLVRRQHVRGYIQRRLVLQIIQPGLVGLMDGSVSTLAPVFAAAFATHNSWNAFLVGLAASLGAGISMGFAESLADDGKLSGRGTPYLRGFVCGLMTIAGGIGHTLPYLIPNFWTATILACVGVDISSPVVAMPAFVARSKNAAGGSAPSQRT